MDFDIRQLDRVDPGSSEAEAAFPEFQDALLERFFNSPEGQRLLEADPDAGFWSAQLMYFGYQYLGVTVPRMKVRHVREVVTELFPRKVSLHSADEADDAIPELAAFWEYLGREFHLRQADAILDLLRDVAPGFKEMMNDPANFGMAKSFFMMGQAAGFDMTREEDTEAFMLAYNAGVMGRRAEPKHPVPVPHVLDSPPRPRRDKSKVKKKRKQARAARKRNRKRQK
jgi:hypothetical protein